MSDTTVVDSHLYSVQLVVLPWMDRRGPQFQITIKLIHVGNDLTDLLGIVPGPWEANLQSEQGLQGVMVGPAWQVGQ